MLSLSRAVRPWCVVAVGAALLCGTAALSQELPRVFLDTTYSPPSGNTISVASGDDLQTKLNAAQPGDTIVLQAGATFAGNFTLPNKTGTAWIYIRSSAYSSLPAPGTRVTPSQASLMPKLVTPNNSPVIATAAAAHNYRFVGVEMTGTAGFTNLVYLDANPQTSLSQAPTDIVFDRCYLHGTSTQTARRGIALNSARTAVRAHARSPRCTRSWSARIVAVKAARSRGASGHGSPSRSPTVVPRSAAILTSVRMLGLIGGRCRLTARRSRCGM